VVVACGLEHSPCHGTSKHAAHAFTREDAADEPELSTLNVCLEVMRRWW
jgi:hypothetical protein